MPRRIETLGIHGPAGQLEALLEEPDGVTPLGCAVVCHPHPLYGGTLHNKVVYRLARAISGLGWAVLRFNFRGVGASEGEYGELRGEIEDARAALAWLRGRYPKLPYALGGFSFGARVATRLACDCGTLRWVVAAGFPTQMGPAGYLESCAAPKIFVQSTHDEFGPRPEYEAMYARVAEPKQLHWVEAPDHFFSGALDEFERTVSAAIS
jgi:uncharacterized protein